MTGEVVGFRKEAMGWEDPQKQVEEEAEEAAMMQERPTEVRDLELRRSISNSIRLPISGSQQGWAA